MEQYLKRTRMQLLNVWATEMETIAAVSMLSTTIYCFSPSGITFKKLRHSPRVASSRMGEEESIYIKNINSHFEIVRKMYESQFLHIHLLCKIKLFS